ncbi:MAG: dihydrofolate reductase [Lachnospiraceae bacterium]|nr:dihydrofolate reductase [Lachnospiraceae bacterium]
MQAIAAADKNWGIGKNGQLLVRIPADMKMFRQETTGKVIIYGRKTLDTFPMRRPLENRTNIILSRNPELTVKNAIVVHSLEELDKVLEPYPDDDIYVIGGASIYEQLLPRCSTVHVTRIDFEYEADCFFPDLDKDPDFVITESSDEQTYFDIAYTFVKYERKS